MVTKCNLHEHQQQQWYDWTHMRHRIATNAMATRYQEQTTSLNLAMPIGASKISTFYASNNKYGLHSTTASTIIFSSQKISLLLAKRIMFISWVFVLISYLSFVTHTTKYSTTVEVFPLFFFYLLSHFWCIF